MAMDVGLNYLLAQGDGDPFSKIGSSLKGIADAGMAGYKAGQNDLEEKIKLLSRAGQTHLAQAQASQDPADRQRFYSMANDAANQVLKLSGRRYGDDFLKGPEGGYSKPLMQTVEETTLVPGSKMKMGSPDQWQGYLTAQANLSRPNLTPQEKAQWEGSMKVWDQMGIGKPLLEKKVQTREEQVGTSYDAPSMMSLFGTFNKPDVDTKTFQQGTRVQTLINGVDAGTRDIPYQTNPIEVMKLRSREEAAAETRKLQEARIELMSRGLDARNNAQLAAIDARLQQLSLARDKFEYDKSNPVAGKKPDNFGTWHMNTYFEKAPEVLSAGEIKSLAQRKVNEFTVSNPTKKFMPDEIAGMVKQWEAIITADNEENKRRRKKRGEEYKAYVQQAGGTVPIKPAAATGGPTKPSFMEAFEKVMQPFADAAGKLPPR